jgi:hypothetical protein
MTESKSRDLVIRGLRGALTAHREGRLLEIGDGWDDAAQLVHDEEEHDDRMSIALNLWEGWADSAEHDWRYYEGMSADDWPRCAHKLIALLEQDVPVDDIELRERFIRHPPRPVFPRLIEWARQLLRVSKA